MSNNPNISEGNGGLGIKLDAVIADVGSLSRVLGIGLALTAIIIGSKLLKASVLPWEDLNIPIQYSWVLLAGFTLVHVFYGSRLISSTHELWQALPESEAKPTFARITANGGVFVKGMKPRTEFRVGRGGIRFYKMAPDDHSALIANVGVLLFIAAIIPFSIERWSQLVLPTLTAFFLGAINWAVGSSWAVALSELTLRKSQALYHQRLDRRERAKQEA